MSMVANNVAGCGQGRSDAALTSCGTPVVCLAEQLRIHHALHELGLTDVGEINEAIRLGNSLFEPLLITRSGTILAGFALWKSALLTGKREIECIEYALNDQESLQFMLSYHQTRRGWNAFLRVRLALMLEPYFQQKAHENMRAGGRFKGSASLPDAQRIDVRQQIASAAAVGARNVTNVKNILNTAHPRLIDALRDGTLTINRAIQFCKLPQREQLEQFTRCSEERAINNVIRGFVFAPKEKKPTPNILAILDALQQEEAQQPGSVVVRVGRRQHTVILVGQDVLSGLYSQKELFSE